MAKVDRDQTTLFTDNAEYTAFVEKFIPKKTTDDCYTPPAVYEAVAEWVATEYGLDRENFVRPFYPDTEYHSFPYPADCVVVDNPPFSLFAQILDWYTEKGIRFFLFGPALTLFSRRNLPGICYLPVGANVTYENGAKVKTSFVTNLDKYKIRTAPDLYEAVQRAATGNKKKKTLPKYAYPDFLVTAALMQKVSQRGVDLRIKPEECVSCFNIASMRAAGTSTYGGAFLLSEAAADRWREAKEAAKAAKEAAKAARTANAENTNGDREIVWELTEKEMEVIRSLK